MKKVLSINDTGALQINPNLGILLTADMEGWFFERYVNIFMNGTVVDFVDNVNYSGAIIHQRKYNYEEVQLKGVENILRHEIDNGHFMHIWVDEMYIPCSIRFNKHHFVHPMMVYGYDEDIIKAVFFDISKGQVLVDINRQDIINSITGLNNYYLYGGTDMAIEQTISSYCLADYLKGTFHMAVLVKQLSDYLCCKTDLNTEWYTLCRSSIGY